jgi:hypothetical protein
MTQRRKVMKMYKPKKQSKGKIRKLKRFGWDGSRQISRDRFDKFEIEDAARLYVFLLHIGSVQPKKVGELLEGEAVPFGFRSAPEMSEWYRALANEIFKRQSETPIRVR